MASNRQSTPIQHWLDSLDLAHFADLFLNQGFTELHHVTNITENELGIIGITQRGYQKRILNHLPTEAEAFLSEFVTGSPGSGTDPSVTKPSIPLHPTRKSENGHQAERQPVFDDETYLLHLPPIRMDAPLANPLLPPRRPAPDGGYKKETDHSPQNPSFPVSESAPIPPPRIGGKPVKRVSDDILNKRIPPVPQPRVRSDPTMATTPPPLPVRDDRPERPIPRQRPTPQVPSRSVHPQALSTQPAMFVIPNDYELDTSMALPIDEPFSVLPHTANQSNKALQDCNDLPSIPPPPPPKNLSGTKGPPSSNTNHPIASHQNQLSRDPSRPVSSPSTGALSFYPSIPAVPNDAPVLPPKSSSSSQSSVLPPTRATTADDVDGIPVLPTPPQPPTVSSVPSIPPRPPSLLSPANMALDPQSLHEAAQLQGWSFEETIKNSLPDLPPPPPPPPNPSVPLLPPRPQTQNNPPAPVPPLHPSKDTRVQPINLLSGGSEEEFMPELPPPPPPTTTFMPAIPPRHPSFPDPPAPNVQPPPLLGPQEIFRHPQEEIKSSQLPSLPPAASTMSTKPLNPSQPSLDLPFQQFELPPPLPPPIETQGNLNIFDAAIATRDPFEFDPFATDSSVDINILEFPLRPPSLFCSPGDYHLPASLPSRSGSVVMPSQHDIPSPLPPSRPAPDLSTVLMSRPVPLPPGQNLQDRPTTATSSAFSAPLLSQVLLQNPTNLQDDTMHSRPSFTTAQSVDTATSLISHETAPQQCVIQAEPPALPVRSSAVLGQKLVMPESHAMPENSPVPAFSPRKTSNLIDLSSRDMEKIKFKSIVEEKDDKSLLDVDFEDIQPSSVSEKYIEDQYAKVHRFSKTAPQLTLESVNKVPDMTHVPVLPPRISPRLEPQGENVPFILPPRLSPIGSAMPDDEYSLPSQAEFKPVSWSSLPIPVSPSRLSDGSSDRHSYILLSDSVSGQDPPDIQSSSVPPSSATTTSLPQEQEASQQPQKPVRRAPPPPVSKSADKTSAPIPVIPARQVLPQKHVIPQLPPVSRNEEYDVLDPEKMHTLFSPLQDEPLDSPERVTFKELAQSEESGDDDDSGFDMDSFLDRPLPKQDTKEQVNIDLAELRSKIELDHVLRMGQAWRPNTTPKPLVRTHSRAVDEKTRGRLSKKLSQYQKDSSYATEVPAKETVLTKKGYLWKQGGKQNNKGFRKRWVEFNGSEIRYYENEKTLSECKGIIPVGTMRDVKNLCGASKIPFGDTKQYRITLETTGRSFHFAAESLDEGTLWANTLMKAIIAYKPPPGGFPVGGDMSCPDKKGYVKIEGYHQKRFLAIKGEILCIYNTEMDFESAVAISDIQMKLGSVKEIQPKNKIQLATPSKIYLFTAENPHEVKEWIDAMMEATLEGLSDHSVLEKIQQNPSNKYCADCRMKDPDWASINLGICICKNCSGLHRNLGVQLSKVRSLKMDIRVWTPSLVQLMLDLGNANSNEFWECNLDETEKAVPDDTIERRHTFILSKYKERKYCQALLSTDKNLNKNLVKVASLGKLEECVRLVFSGANVLYTGEDGKSAYDAAKASKFFAVAEFLNQSVGIQIPSARHNGSPVVPARTDRKSVLKPIARESKQEIISHDGYLYKAGNGKKEFTKFYCTLKHGIFSYFEDRNQPCKNTVEGIDMVLVALAEPKQTQKYCFEIYTSSGKTYLFAAETEEQRKKWMIVLAKIHSLDCMWESLEDFEQAGFMHKKEGAAATNWQRLWLILKAKSLVSYSSANDELDGIDLRKLISLSRQDTDSTGASVLSLVLPGKNIYLRAETKQAADCWYEAINKVTTQSGQALEDQLLTADNVPIVVSQCISFVATHEGIMTEGIYRLSGTSSVIRRIVMSYMEDPRTARLKEEFSVHDVTGALKKFFRELTDPLLTSKLYTRWTEVASYQDHSIRLQWYQHLLGELPSVNYDTLKMLIGHLKNVADNSDFNKMYIRNLAAVFGPTLMASSDSSYVHAEHEIAVIADLLTYYAWLFGVSDEEMAKEREKELKCQEGLSRIRAAQAAESAPEQLIIMEIFMGRREQANSINIKISMDHTAADIIKLALEQQKIADDNTWSLFEVIAKGELERLIHGYERVLPQVLSWNQQMAADNYICIKHNDLMDKLQPFMEQATLTDIVKYSESKKNFKKYTFELMNNMITCYKEKSTTPAGCWKVADMRIYVGVEKKRSPPTQWGISFTLSNEEGMKAMCLEKEPSYLFWLAGLIKSKRDAITDSPARSVVHPSSLTYSSHALSFRSEHESSFVRYSRNLPKEISNITSKMNFWRKSRASSVDDT